MFIKRMDKSPLRFLLDSAVKAWIKSINTEELKVLDIGSGKNPYKRFFVRSRYISIDLEKKSDVDVICDAIHLPFKDETFDIVLCLNVLEHIYDYLSALKEIKRVTKTKGDILVATPFFFPLHDIPNDYYRFTNYHLERCFRELRMRVRVFPLSLPLPFQKRIPIYYFVAAKKTNR